SGPHSFEWYNNYLYVSENDKIRRANDLDGNGVYTFDAGFSIPLPGPQGHSTRTLHFGPDGKLYVTVGSSCNICDEGGLHATAGFDPRRAAMLRFNPDGTIPADNPFAGSGDVNLRPVWAYGLRNSVDFTWTPGGTLWASSHGSDNILDNNGQPDTLPPEELVIPVAKGLSHGWPYCYTPVNGLNQPTQNEVRDTRMALPNGFTCADAIPALFTAPAHAAPIGMGWGPASYWPAEYRDDLYQALHGSWNTNNPANYRDCKVERIEINNGQITGSSTLVGGFRAPNTKCGDATTYGRPADVVASPKGEMFISDDQKHRIYRLVYIGN
ncbi:MAG: PQQ-dependent sugar dehydrogenase, partial [Anaerolineae bacterium]|nr:PQQ-dependent sugar dehydrogenase [Anaerolineae bacterium]